MRPYGSAARFRLEGGREPRPIAARRWVRVAAAAAVVVAALWAVPKVFRTAVPGGVDQSGRIDILNAFQLARRVARSERLDATWDVTGDGVVDGDLELARGGQHVLVHAHQAVPCKAWRVPP